MAAKKKDKPTIYVITGSELEVHKVKTSEEVNSLFESLGICKVGASNSPGVEMYDDEAEQFTAFVMRGGKPIKLNISMKFHLDVNDDG